MSVWTSVLILSNSDWNYVTPGKGECGKESVHGRIRMGVECAWEDKRGLPLIIRTPPFPAKDVNFRTLIHSYT